MVGRDFGAELFGAPESPTPTTETGRDFGAELFGTPPVARTLAPEEPPTKPGFFEQLKKSFVEVGVPQTQAAMQGFTLVAQAGQIANTADKLKALEAAGQGESKEAEGLRKTLDFYTKRQGKYFEGLTKTQAELKQAPTYAGVRKLSEAKSFAEGFKTFAEDPVNIVANLTAQSLPTAIPGLILGVINPALGAATLGGSSFGTEFGGSLLEFADDKGYDTSNPEQMAAFFAELRALRFV